MSAPAIIESVPVRLDWSAYGVRCQLLADDAEALAVAIGYLPLGWLPAVQGDADLRYALRGAGALRRLYRGAEMLAEGGLEPLLAAFASAVELDVAELARTGLFVHAGVVGWGGRAILIPGRSFSGKTSLVAALVAAGATYYSDEYAVIDQAGLVYPYPRPLAIRGPGGEALPPTPVERLGGRAGTEPLPAGLIVVTAYADGARWRPRPLSPGRAMLALMDNTVAARRDPRYSMPILRQTASQAPAIQSRRGDAALVAAAILASIPELPLP